VRGYSLSGFDRFCRSLKVQVGDGLEPLRLEPLVWVAENEITYGEDDTWQTISILDLRDGKVVREAIYFAKPFLAPDWRAQLVDREARN
jgi:hypothetical protein